MGNWLSQTREFQAMPLHVALRTKRLVEGFSQRELALRLSIPQPTLSGIESCNRMIPRKYFRTILDYLYGESDSSSKKEKRSLEKEQQVYVNGIALNNMRFSKLGGEEGLMHVSELPKEEREAVILGLRFYLPSQAFFLSEAFKVTVLTGRENECVAMGRLQDFYDVLFTPNGIELTDKNHG